MLGTDWPDIGQVSINTNEVVTPGLKMQGAIDAPLRCADPLQTDEFPSTADDPHVVVQTAWHLGPAKNKLVHILDGDRVRREQFRRSGTRS